MFEELCVVGRILAPAMIARAIIWRIEETGENKNGGRSRGGKRRGEEGGEEGREKGREDEHQRQRRP